MGSSKPNSIAMQRRKYTAATGPLLPGFSYRAMFDLLMAVGLGAYLESNHGIPYAMPAAMVGGFLVVGVAYFVLKRRALAQLPCPQCGAAPLESMTDGEDRLLLICHTCRIEWQTDYMFRE